MVAVFYFKKDIDFSNFASYNNKRQLENGKKINNKMLKK